MPTDTTTTDTTTTDTEATLEDCIDTAKTTIGSAWPLHSFVTANPLAGFEDRPFHEAAAEADRLFGSEGYPSADVFRAAWERGQIDPDRLDAELTDHGYDLAPEAALDRLAADDTDETEPNPHDRVDEILTKWLAAFLDQGQTDWAMPNREQGFYAAFRTVARHDGEIPNGESITALPDEPLAAIDSLLADYPTDQWERICEYQITALPGWAGLIKQQADSDDAWQSVHPITIEGYLAVRLAVADALGLSLEPPADTEPNDTDDVPLAECWLTAWERSHREELIEAVSDASGSLAASDDSGRPDAQLVFCIDTRSEIIRRHIESTGSYETHGYAGFFGVPIEYKSYTDDVTVDACPPIVDPAHRITERPSCGHNHDHDHTHDHATHDRWVEALHGGKQVVKKLKSNAATAFSFVETAGAGYGAALAGRTLMPNQLSKLMGAVDDRIPDTQAFCEPSVDYNPDGVHDLREGLLLDEKVEYAKTAFDLMGIEEFARLFVFTGHGSHTSNNPFDSSLDCGACAGNHGGPNARVIAAICNDEEVRAELRADGYDIPEETVFVAAEHNTTTDEIDLYAHDIPESHADDLDQLQADLEAARKGAAAERADQMGADGDGVTDTERRAADWAETRPEWGLAGNASFVIGPRELTADYDLDGRAFLHSYDWSTDDEGEALAAIMAGPMVVCQWINTHYYFATVDTAAFGSGSKITQNPVGNVGVYQGNGGDLLTGLPLQSVMMADDEPYHQPLRLSTVIHAPLARVEEILEANAEVTQLLDNNWLSLTVVDPTQDHTAFDYAGDLSWTPLDGNEVQPECEPTPVAAVADD